MGMKHKTLESFKYAKEGLNTALRREPSFKLLSLITAAAIILALLLRFNILEWLILILTIVFVYVIELINTSIEATVNLISPDIKDEAKVAKDVSAAAVMLASAMAGLVGLMLFVPKIFTLLLN